MSQRPHLRLRFRGKVAAYAQSHPTGLAVLGHLLLTTLFFAKVFAFGYTLFTNLDYLTQGLPAFMQTRRDFLRGHCSFWDPNLLCGVPRAMCCRAPQYLPENWLLFLLPARYLVMAATIVAFLRLWLIGVLSYLAFREELGRPRWAFFGSIAYTLCGATIWQLLLFDNFSMWFYATLLLYLIWTMHRRASYLNLTYLTIGLVLMLMPSMLTYGLMLLVVCGLGFLYRWLGRTDLHGLLKHGGVLTTAMMVASLLFSIRVLPSFIELHDSSRAEGWTPMVGNCSWLGLHLFNPELFGLHVCQSRELFDAWFPPVEGDITKDRVMNHYFGVLPTLLVVWALLCPSAKPRRKILAFFVGCVLGTTLWLQPFTFIYQAVIFPVMTGSMLPLLLPFAFCLLAAGVGQDIEEAAAQGSSLRAGLARVSIALMFVLFYIYTMFWVEHFRDYAYAVKAGGLALMAAALGVYLLFSLRLTTGLRLCAWVAGITLPALLALHVGYLLSRNPNDVYVCAMRELTASVALLLLVLLGLFLLKAAPCRTRTALFAAGTTLITLLGLSMTLLQGDTHMLFPEDKGEALCLACLGTARLLVAFAIFGVGVVFLQRKVIGPVPWFALVLLALAFDIWPAAVVHAHRVVSPFYPGREIFPEQNPALADASRHTPLDLANYRVNCPNTLVAPGIPFYREMVGIRELHASIFSLYGVRSYGGYENGVPPRYADFLRALASGSLNYAGGGLSHGLQPDLQDARLLALCGVKYEPVPGSDRVRELPGALARMMLFTDAEVVSDGKAALDRLKDPAFDPLHKVIVDRDLGARPGPGTSSARVISYAEPSTDCLSAHVETDRPGILLFNDNYNKGWNAYVDGKPQPIAHANYTFMAVAVPAGSHQILLRYRQRGFVPALWLAGSGLGLALVVGSILFFLRLRFDRDVLHAEASPLVSCPAPPLGWKPARLVAISLCGLLLLVVYHTVRADLAARREFQLPKVPGPPDHPLPKLPSPRRISSRQSVSRVAGPAGRFTLSRLLPLCYHSSATKQTRVRWHFSAGPHDLAQ